jgi:hypothetical protein
MTTTHPITGRTTMTLGGEVRTLAFDMNFAAALDESVGRDWLSWLAKRFIGEQEDSGRRVTPLSPRDTITVLYAALAGDREVSLILETESSLRASISPLDLCEINLAIVRVVLTGLEVPGEAVEAVLSAMNEPRNLTAPGTGSVSSVSPSVPFKSTRSASGGSPSRSGARSSRATPTASKPTGARRRGSSRTS